jgi:antirestriction protein ArdC
MKRKTRVKPDLYQVITDKVIALLEAGTVPWQRPWNQYGLARNYATGHVYTGINAFLLNFFPSFDVPFYLTYKQAQALGGQVRKGAKAETVYFFKTLYKDADGKNLKPAQIAKLGDGDKFVKAIPMPRTFHLFNIADIDGIDFDIPELSDNPNAPIEACDNFVTGLQSVPEIQHKDLNQAFYAPVADQINMPPLPRFSCSPAYYKTLFHEVTHSTGHESRLSRPGITLPMEQRVPGSEPHAHEELIAELGAVYLCQHAGISRQPLQENAAAYIDSYLQLLKNDKRFLFQASSQAQKAVNFLLEAPT